MYGATSLNYPKSWSRNHLRKKRNRRVRPKEKKKTEKKFSKHCKSSDMSPSTRCSTALPNVTSLSRCGADLVFNLTESFAGDDTKEMNVAAYMDLLGIRYTGGGP